MSITRCFSICNFIDDNKLTGTIPSKTGLMTFLEIVTLNELKQTPTNQFMFVFFFLVLCVSANLMDFIIGADNFSCPIPTEIGLLQLFERLYFGKFTPSN